MNLETVNARPCDTSELLAQIGRMNVFAISGGRVTRIYNDGMETVGVRLPISSGRRVDVVLDWTDTYIVRRVRRVTRGANRGQDVIEAEQSSVYCDEVGEVAYQLSCWK